MAEALFREGLSRRAPIVATSAGFLPPGAPCPEPVLEVMAEVGIDLSGHSSRRVSADLVASAALVIAMTRQHVVDLAVEFPRDWDRFFTLSDLVERARAAGERGSDETLREWGARLQSGRQRADLLQLSAERDIADPIGRPLRTFRRVRDQLADLVGGLAGFVAPD